MIDRVQYNEENIVSWFQLHQIATLAIVGQDIFLTSVSSIDF